MITEKNVHDLYEWYKNLESRLNNILEYTPFQVLEDAKVIISPRCVSIIVESSSIIDSLFRTLFPEKATRANGKTITANGANIYDFYKSFENTLKLTSTQSILLGSQPELITPFEKWGEIYPNIPKWWTSYNHLKHNRLANSKDGNMYNAIMSLCGLQQLMTKIPEILKYSFRYEWIKFSGYNPAVVFDMIKVQNNSSFLSYTKYFCTPLKPMNWENIESIRPLQYENSTRLVEYLGRLMEN